MFRWLKKNRPELTGWIDNIDRHHVAGWAAYPGGIPPKLFIEVDGVIVGETIPKYARPDLAAAYGPNIALGYYFVFPQPLARGDRVAVIDQYGRPLMNSPETIKDTSPEEDLSDVSPNLSTPVPGSELIFLVNGHHDRRHYAAMRYPAVQTIIEQLDRVGIDYKTFRTILDFGCGCGRILAGWEPILPKDATLLGCDINPKLIEFCNNNIPFAQTWVSSYFPPLEHIADGALDFVYAASVLTHVTRDAAQQWAKEMDRIVRPNGILMISYMGGYYRDALKDITPQGYSELESTGFYCHVHGTPQQTFLGSNDYATYMDSTFVRNLFQNFDLIGERLGLIEGSSPFMSFQDIAILRRHA